jgi:hypothetical protein
MSQIFYSKNAPNFLSCDADTDTTTSGVSCLGLSSARYDVQVATLTDAGTIDQTVAIQGSVDGTNYNTTAIATVNITGASPLTANFFSGVVDIRGYAKVRLVYTSNDASAGTVVSNLNLVLG